QRTQTDEYHESWRALEDTFTYQVELWFYRHSKYREAMAREEAFFYIHGAFGQLFEASRKKQLIFTTLEQAFSYLKRCLNSTILQQLRRFYTSQLVPLPDPEPAGPDMVNQILNHLEAQALWNCLIQCTKTEQERELVDLVYRQKFKPREIADRFPGT